MKNKIYTKKAVFDLFSSAFAFFYLLSFIRNSFFASAEEADKGLGRRCIEALIFAVFFTLLFPVITNWLSKRLGKKIAAAMRKDDESILCQECVIYVY